MILVLLKIMLIAVFAIVFIPNVSQAKEGNGQNQIILLYDSASALEGDNPALSKMLAQFADEKEKEWENQNAGKNASPGPVMDKNSKQFQDRIKLLKTAALAVQPTYPLIAKGLDQMVKDMDGTSENKK